MSEQPPYGEPIQPPEQPPSYPQAPYVGSPYPGPAQAPYGVQPPKSNGTRNVLLIVAAVVVLFCGGAVALGVLAFNNVKDTVDSAFDDDYRGSEKDPIEVELGAAFEIRGLEYDAGWMLDTASEFTDGITALRATNSRDDKSSEYISLSFTFLKGNEIQAQVNCSTGGQVGYRQSKQLDCSTADDVAADFDTIEVYDNATFQ